MHQKQTKEMESESTKTTADLEAHGLQQQRTTLRSTPVS